LVAQVLKAKYYPNNSLMDAKIGSTPGRVMLFTQMVCSFPSEIPFLPLRKLTHVA